MTDRKQATLIDTVRTVCDLLDHHKLRPLRLGFGLGGPQYVDVIVKTWQAVANWAGTLELTDIRPDDNSRSVARGEAHGFEWRITSEEQYGCVV